MATDPDVVSHINGGPTAVSLEEAHRLVDETSYTLEIVHCGIPELMKGSYSEDVARKVDTHFIREPLGPLIDPTALQLPGHDRLVLLLAGGLWRHRGHQERHPVP